MCYVNMYEAKTNLSKYVEQLEKGEEKEIFLCRRGKKIAKIILVEDTELSSILGAGKGLCPNYDLSKIDDPSLKEEIAKEFGY